MSVADAPGPVDKPLQIKPVLRDTTRLYRTLFGRSFITGFIVFAILGVFDILLAHTKSEATAIVILVIAAAGTFVGTTFVQGALVEAVDSEHRGRPAAGLSHLYRTSWVRLGSLVRVSLLTGIGVGVGVLLLIVPGVLLAIRWALAAPIVMLEGQGARAAMQRSGELVRGHRRAVFRVLVNVWGRVVLAWIALSFLFGLLGATPEHHLALWLAGVIASALITPYAGHALSVMYYRLTDPEQPVLPEPEPDPNRRWESIWHDRPQNET